MATKPLGWTSKHSSVLLRSIIHLTFKCHESHPWCLWAIRFTDKHNLYNSYGCRLDKNNNISIFIHTRKNKHIWNRYRSSMTKSERVNHNSLIQLHAANLQTNYAYYWLLQHFISTQARQKHNQNNSIYFTHQRTLTSCDGRRLVGCCCCRLLPSNGITTTTPVATWACVATISSTPDLSTDWRNWSPRRVLHSTNHCRIQAFWKTFSKNKNEAVWLFGTKRNSTMK